MIALAVLVLLIFSGDAIALRVRSQANRFSTMQVRPYYAVKLKDGKTEYMFTDPQDETCVHSLFPQLGYRPCWYVGKAKTKELPLK